MTLEKPWKNEFEVLLEHLTNHFGGKIKRPDPNKSTAYIFVYPTFYAVYKDFEFMVEISEHPSGDKSMLEASDNIEYLRVFYKVTSPINVGISHEGWIFRLQKMALLEWEQETGNKEFDRKYILRAKSDKNRDFLCNPAAQELIRNLEPFTAVRIYEGGIWWSREIRNKEILQIDTIRNLLPRLNNLAELLRKVK